MPKFKDGRSGVLPAPKKRASYSRALTEPEHAYIDALEQIYSETGEFPTQHYVNYNYPLLQLPLSHDELLLNERFVAALLARGITPPKATTPTEELPQGSPNKLLLSEIQLATANTLLDFRDRRSNPKKLSELGVSTQQYQNWLRDPTYQAYIKSRAEDLFGDNLSEVHMALLNRAMGGDVASIKLIYDVTGFRPDVSRTESINHSTLTADPSLNPSAPIDQTLFLQRLVDILQRHITDPTLLAKIADDLALIDQRPTDRLKTPVISAVTPATRPVGELEPPVSKTLAFDELKDTVTTI